ncbi:MAG TPA: tyrosine-protein phosphatase [Desulfitobacteriaceae bacterium]|nr:tyrosine-protein phosphatase [Desulfitobacteriaceae bacterium]
MLREVIPDFWRSSEEETYFALKEDGLTIFRTIICLRRKLPVWWPPDSNMGPNEVTYLHFPVPPSFAPTCPERILELLRNVLPYVDLPVLFFCKEGKNRTGMIAAIIKYFHSGCFSGSLNEYLEGVSGAHRESELVIIKKLAKKN